jgi:hypothetical protein
MRPLARKEKLTIRELPEETLIYDLERHALHCLNRTAALVWKHCDGRHDAAALAALLAGKLGLPAEEAEAAARLALEQLGRRKLLQEAVAPPEGEERLTRRGALRQMTVAAAASLPLIMTLKSPSVAWAQMPPDGSFQCTSAPRGVCPDGFQPKNLTNPGKNQSFNRNNGTTCFCVPQPVSSTTTTTTTTTTTRPPACGQVCEVGVTSCPAGCRCSGSGPVGSEGTCVPA